jgi:CHAT domain-containing protein/Tfp pilus assembly protein PilF
MAIPGIRLVLCTAVLLAGSTAALRSPVSQFSPTGRSVTSGKTVAVKPKRVEMQSLGRQREVTRHLPSGVVHRYRILLQAGYVLDAAVDQDIVEKDRLDLLVQLYQPNGNRLFKVDSPNDDRGSEPIFLLAETTGYYQVELDGGKNSGTYRLRLRSQRPASTEDRTRARANKLYYRGRELSKETSTEDAAVKHLLESERLWRVLGDRGMQGAALHKAALVLANEHHQRSIELLESALDFYIQAGDLKEQTNVLNELGDGKRDRGELDAEGHYQRALELAHSSGYTAGEANALMGLARLRVGRGDYEEGLRLFEKSRRLWRGVSRKDNEIRALNSIGLVYAQLGKLPEALDSHGEALRLCADDDFELRAQTYSRMSEVFEKLGKAGQAEDYARRSLALRKNVGEPHGIQVATVDLGLALRRMGRFSDARKQFLDAWSILKGWPDLQGKVATQINLGWVELDLKNSAIARSHFEEALDLLKGKQGSREDRASAYYGLAQVARYDRNPRAASFYAEKAIEEIEKMSQGLLRTDLQADFMATKQTYYDLLIDVLARVPAKSTPMPDVIRAFEVNETARSRSFIEGLAPVGIRASVLRRASREDRERRKELQDQAEELTRIRWKREREERSIEAVQKELRATMDRLRALDAELLLRDAWTKQLKRKNPISLREVQDLLDPETLLVEYRLGPRRSLAWLVSRSSIDMYELPSREKIESEIRQVHDWFGSEREAKKASRKMEGLSEALLPFASRLGSKRLVIVPDGALHYLPFELLREKAADPSSALVFRHELLSLPSVSVLKAMRAVHLKRPAPQSLIAVLAAPEFKSERYAPLPHSGKEAQAIIDIVSRLPKKGGFLKATGRQATKDLILSGRLRGYDILHLATHGNLDSEHPELSSLILSEVSAQGNVVRGELTAHEIQGLELYADLVVLSACNTALGREVRGEGLIGLNQAFFYAGARRIVLSLWNVNDESTPYLMDKFYRALLVEGKPPAEALRSAQVWMARQTDHKRWQDPYYWAGFVLEGDWH